MAKQRRAFSNYPELLQTRQNNRETFIADDPSFEPEQASFLNGFIGDTSVLTVEDLERTPPIREGTAERQKYQLSVGATFVNPATRERESVATYTDLVNQIEANGGLVDDPNRVFATEFYAWTPPIDYDKHINFGRYLWTAAGTAQVQGEYVTKEPSHSKTVVHVWDGVTLTAKAVLIFNGLPAIMAAGTYVEDASTLERLVYLSDGVSWQLLNLEVVDDVPTSFPPPAIQPPPIYYYVARTGPDYQRPLVWKYTEGSGRWIPTPVVVNPDVPDIPRDGMVWEDSRLNGERVLKVFSNGTFQDLSYTSADGPPGTPGTDGDYIYDTREYATLTDPWALRNWWRHYEDLSSVDREARSNDDSAVRPILEFWQGIESVAGDTRDYRNDSPVYKKYAIDDTTFEGFDTTEGTTIFEYQRGSGQDDSVLGFPVSFNNTGEFIFDLTLEKDASAAIGYHYFLDTNTGLLHSIWHRAMQLTHQNVDANGLYDVPVGISSNADHEILTQASRSRMVGHMTSVMGSQAGFSGSLTGQNSYRWTDKDPTIGATLIDAEETHLRSLATLQNSDIDFPNAIRRMAKDYNKVLFRFTNKLNQLWDNLSLTNGNGSLTMSASEACDSVLTSIFTGRNSEFPFFYSQMGTFLQTLATNGVATVLDPNPMPIFIPPSPPRVGASPVYLPRLFTRPDGSDVLLGHEGVRVPSFGDERDLVWLELQNRFFGVVPDSFKTETASISSRFSQANITLSDHYGNYVPQTSIEPVDDVVSDYNAIVGPIDGFRVLSTDTAEFAIFSGGEWLVRPAITDDIVLNNGDGEYYIFNGLGVFLIDRWNRPFDFEYTINEFRQIIRRDFERYIIFRAEDFGENVNFSSSDPFTWNYRSAGVEGHYLGIYARVYNTTRPHAAPWEVMGYSIEPDWWRTQYVPDSTAPDGSPRYGSAHIMWADFAAGTVAHPSGSITKSQFVVAGPVPVDSAGELLDPIAAGVIDQSKLDMARIDDFWSFGDGSPMEQDFYESPFASFSISLAGYLMKNGKWVDTLWVANRAGIGTTGTYPVHNAPHIVNGDTLTRPDIGTRPIHLAVVDGEIQVNIGVHSWISEKVNVEGNSPTADFAVVVRNTSPALVWKTSGYINQSRTTISTLARNEIPFSDVHVLLHKSQPISQNFCSGVLVVREDTGYRVFGYDPFDPFFTVERSAIPIVAGQVLLEQEFTVDYIITDPQVLNNDYVTGGSVLPNRGLQRTFEVTEFGLPSKVTAGDTAVLAVIVNGLRMKPQHITTNTTDNTVTIEDIVAIQAGDRVAVQVLTTQQNPSTHVRQFIVNNVTFPYFTEGTGEFERIEYGRFYETSTEVINFMMGYGRFLEAQGWKFESLAEGGTTRDWLLGARRFATWVLEVESQWNPNPQLSPSDQETFYYSPVEDLALFESPYGQSTSVETIMNGAYGILNSRSEPVKTDSTEVTRIGDTVEVRRLDVTDDESQMFGVRINLIEAEHVVVFSNTTRFNDVIYDPVSGLSQRTLFVDSYRTLNWRGRLEADGYILSGGLILPNFEKQAFDFTRFYDRFNTIDDPVKRESARNLYGYVPANQSRILNKSKTPNVERRITSDSSQYMVPVGAADRTRFDYYRGMIQTKGTNRAAYAFVRGSTIGRDNFFINEDWAWKVGPGEFGDTRRELVQIDVERLDFRDEIQVIHFGGPINTNNNTVEILDFDRNDPDANPRWITPPIECETMDSCNLTFPISRDNTGAPIPERTFIDFSTVSGVTLDTGSDGDYFDISTSDEDFRVWFDVEAFQIVEITTVDASNFVQNGVGNSIILSEVTSDVEILHHLWYSVEDTEASTITFNGVTGDLFTSSGAGDYFTLGLAGTLGAFYYVWFNVNSGNTDPAPGGGVAGIEVALTGNDTDNEVAAAVTTALNDSGFFVADAPQPPDEVVNVTHVLAGQADDAANFNAPAGIVFATTNQGIGPNTDPGSSPNGHKVVVGPLDTADTVAVNTSAVLSTVSGFSGTTVTEDTMSLTNAVAGPGTAPVDVNTGFTSIITKAGDEPNSSPPSAGRTLIQVMVTSTFTSQQVSDAVVAALQGAATQFQSPRVTNNNGTSTTVVVVLPYPISANAALGVFSTPPTITVTPSQFGKSLIDVTNYKFYAKLYDTEANLTILDHFHYDPELGKFDTGATCFVDYDTPQDPARYNSGPDAAFSNDRCWRDIQVGKTWWNQDRKQYLDYRSFVPDYEDAAKIWGKLLYYKAAITRTDDVVTMTMYQFDDIKRTGNPVNLANDLGLSDGDEVTVTVRKASQTEYNLQNQTVTVVGASTGQLAFEIDTGPDTPATGDPEVVFGHIDIYEWVESPVLPSEWIDYVSELNDPTVPNGTPLNLGNPSFSEIVRLNDNNQPTTFYYFWVLNSTGNNGAGKPLTSATISSRIANPTLNQIPWFSPVDESNMLIFTDGDAVLDDYAIEISIDQRENQTHGAFVLISQGARFFDTPEPIIEKLVDSMAKLDEKGNTVPSPLLAESEKYGSCFFPIQTVYADVDAAVDVYTEATNRLFSRKDLEGVDFVTGIFKLSDEQTDSNPDGFWVRTQYVNNTVEGVAVYDTVQTITERDRRAGLGLYFPDDIVRVIESGATDIWDGTEVATNYQYDGTLFIEVAVDNHTIAINENIVDDPVRFRGLLGVEGLFTLIYNLLTKAEKNSLVFSLLHEMKVQHPDPRCDWFFKTSYLTTQVFTTTDKSPFVRPDEVSAIRDNILGVKAYRSKFRGDVNTLTISEVEPFETNILEFPDKKVSLIIDRLSCNLIDDCGWDAPPWDSRALPCDTWDTPLWDFDDLGRERFYLLGTITGNNVDTQFIFDAVFDPTLYNIKTVVKQNGVVVDADYIVVTKSHTQVFIDTQFVLPPSFTVEILQSQGFYAESEPSYIGTTMEGTLFQPPASDYKHAVARSSVPPTEFYTVVAGDGSTFSTTTGPWIELYLNSTLLEAQVDYTKNFDYATSTYSATLTVAPAPGDVLAFGFIRGCFNVNDDLGGRPEERIITEVCDSVNICVINDWTLAYNGWDSTPWDVVFWDQGPTNVGRRVFLISVGKQEEIPPGIEFFPTSENITVVDPFAIVGTNPMTYNIEQFELQKGGAGPYVPMTEGVEFGLIGVFNNSITTLIPEQEDFIADGVGFVFATTGGTEIAHVFLDGVLQVEGVNYMLDVTRTTITWVQPAPVIFANNATANGEAYVGDGFTTDFDTGQPADSLNIENIQVWLNGVPSTTWSIVGSTVRFVLAPAIGDEIIIHTVGNAFADNTAAYATETFVASAAQTVFNTSSGGFVNSDTVWVYTDSSYQVLGTDYTVTGPDQITFVVPLAGGETVSIRYLNKSVNDVEHIVFSASGTATDVIPGLLDGQVIDRMLIFVADDIQNGWAPPPVNPDYTITNTNPDTINWNLRQELTDLDWTGITGATLPTGVTPAAWFDISTVSTTYRLWFSDGSTTAPVAGGTTLVPVAFTGADTDQDISDAVVAALVGADIEFSSANNGGGVFRVVSVEVATGGAVPDAVDGAVATNVTISILVQGNDPPAFNEDITVRVIRSIQMSTTVVIDVNPDPGQTVSAQFVPFIESGDRVRYRFNGWPVGPEGYYTVNPLTPPLDTIGYDIVSNVFTFDSLPTENNTFALTYTRARPGGLPESILVRMENIVADILPDHESYDAPNGFNTFRPVGTQIINTTTNRTYTWDGTIWNTDPAPVVGSRYYVTRPQQIWEWNGAAFIKLFDVGDVFTKPPVLGYPAFGEGITYGTYAFGSSTNAAVEYEDAYQIMQHPGDCPP